MSKANKEKELQNSAPAQPKYKTEQLIAYILFFYFVIYFSILEIFKTLDLSVYNSLRLLALTIGISFFIPIKLYRKKLRLSYYEYIIYNFIFIGPLTLLLILLLNIGFTSNSYIESYTIIEKTKHEESGETLLTLENESYKDKPYLRKVKPTEKIGNIQAAKKLTIEFQDGLFGIRKIKSRSLD